MLVRVPFGRRDVVGLICEVTDHSDVPADKLRAVAAICSTLRAACRTNGARLTAFAAEYYQRGLGEVALPALPQALRDASRWARLFAPEERYRLTAGRARSAARCACRRARARCAGSPRRSRAKPTLAAADARALHPKASATLDEWQVAGLGRAGNGDPEAHAVLRRSRRRAARRRRACSPRLTAEQRQAVDAIRDAQVSRRSCCTA